MKFYKIIIAIVCMAALLATTHFSKAQSVDIALSQVGDPGNAADTTGYGSVGYTYDIGTFDVTISQYCTFLDAVAQSDPYGLYDGDMIDMGNYSGVSGVAGITQSGAFGSYIYSIVNGSGNDPATYVSWFDAARFCNWLENGQPTNLGEAAGSTETGSYTLNGDTSGGLETRNPGAVWVIPTENEWYKAAYYDPQLNSDSGGFYAFATQSNAVPGNVVGGGANEANYIAANNDYSVTQSSSYSSTQNYLTLAGAFTQSASFYGTYDQNGDVDQWTEAVTSDEFREMRGGDWNSSSDYMESTSRSQDDPEIENYDFGFRVVEAIPEPNSIMSILAGIAGLAVIRGKPFKL